MRDSQEAYEKWLEKEIETLKAQNYQLRLSLRDQFAAAALTGWLADGHVNTLHAADRAYEYADAMLKAREATSDDE